MFNCIQCMISIDFYFYRGNWWILFLLLDFKNVKPICCVTQRLGCCVVHVSLTVLETECFYVFVGYPSFVNWLCVFFCLTVFFQNGFVITFYVSGLLNHYHMCHQYFPRVCLLSNCICDACRYRILFFFSIVKYNIFSFIWYYTWNIFSFIY